MCGCVTLLMLLRCCVVRCSVCVCVCTGETILCNTKVTDTHAQHVMYIVHVCTPEFLIEVGRVGCCLQPPYDTTHVRTWARKNKLCELCRGGSGDGVRALPTEDAQLNSRTRIWFSCFYYLSVVGCCSTLIRIMMRMVYVVGVVVIHVLLVSLSIQASSITI